MPLPSGSWRISDLKGSMGMKFSGEMDSQFVPPIGGGICLEFAVRVRELFSEEDRIGFSYETLAGHPEQGISEFYFTKDDDGLRFFIHTFSQPGHWTSRAFSGLAIRYQSWCTQRALKYIREQFALHNRDLPS